jgi:uncharacterized membrane protein
MKLLKEIGVGIADAVLTVAAMAAILLLFAMLVAPRETVSIITGRPLVSSGSVE